MSVKAVHVKNISDGVAFFAPLNRMLRPNEIVDVLRICENNSDMALMLVRSYESHPQIQVFKLYDQLPTPEGEMQGSEETAPPVAVETKKSKKSKKE